MLKRTRPFSNPVEQRKVHSTVDFVAKALLDLNMVVVVNSYLMNGGVRDYHFANHVGEAQAFYPVHTSEHVFAV
jgi:hypothetical protein